MAGQSSNISQKSLIYLIFPNFYQHYHWEWSKKSFMSRIIKLNFISIFVTELSLVGAGLLFRRSRLQLLTCSKWQLGLSWFMWESVRNLERIKTPPKRGGISFFILILLTVAYTQSQILYTETSSGWHAAKFKVCWWEEY